MKKTIILTLVALLTFSCVQASSLTEMLMPGKGQVYDKVEVMPEFPGGHTKMIEFLCENIKYPKEAAERGEQGKVCVGFVVDTDGSITEVSVLKSVSKVLDEAAVEIVKKMPKWTPGKQDGKTVRVKLALPITFTAKK